MELMNYIGGKFERATGGEWLEVKEPATGDVFA